MATATICSVCRWQDAVEALSKKMDANKFNIGMALKDRSNLLLAGRTVVPIGKPTVVAQGAAAAAT